jgi:hypothetical protein
VIVLFVGLLVKTEIEKLNCWPIAAAESEATLSAASGGSFGSTVGGVTGVPTVFVGVAGVTGVATVFVAVATVGGVTGVPTVFVAVTCVGGVLVRDGVTGVFGVAVGGVTGVGGVTCPVPGGLVCVTRCSSGAAGATRG